MPSFLRYVAICSLACSQPILAIPVTPDLRRAFLTNIFFRASVGFALLFIAHSLLPTFAIFSF